MNSDVARYSARLLMIVTAMQIGSVAQAQANLTEKDLIVIRNVATSLCQRPDLYGMSKSTNGNVSGALDVSKLTRGLVTAGARVSLKTESNVWRGLLQKDAAAALKDGNICVTDMFKVIIARYAPSGGATAPATVRPIWQRANNYWPQSPGEFQDFKRRQAEVMAQCGRCMKIADRSARAIGGISNSAGSRVVFDGSGCTFGIRLALMGGLLMQADNAPPAISTRFSVIDIKPGTTTSILIDDIVNFQFAPIACL